MSYMLIPHIKVQKANALAAPWLVSVSPVFASVMFAHNLGRATKKQPTGIGVIHHDYQLLAETDMPGGFGGIEPHQYRAALYIDKQDYNSKSKQPVLSLQATVSAHEEVSLVLAYDKGLPDEETVKAWLFAAKLAGGSISDHGNISFHEHLTGQDSVESKLKNGFWMLDRSELLLSENLNGESRIIKMLEIMSARGGDTPWIVPATLGYAMVTEFEKRDNVREATRPDTGKPIETLHAFAEAMVGLIEYKSIRKREEENIKRLLWRGEWIREDVFVVNQNTPEEGAFA